MENENKFCVYTHLKKDTNEIFYVGMGSIQRPYAKINRNRFWINIANKYDYDICILGKNLTKDEAIELEIEMISKIGRRDLGTGTLVNLTKGGEGNNYWQGKRRSSETKKKISAAKKGTITSAKTKKKLSIAGLGRIVTDETRLKIKESLTGRTHSAERRKNIADGLKKSGHSNKGCSFQ